MDDLLPFRKMVDNDDSGVDILVRALADMFFIVLSIGGFD